MNKYYVTLAAVAASTATLVAVTIVADPAPAPADPFLGLHMSAPEIPDDEILGAPIVSYESESLDYKVSFPGAWHLEESPEGFDGHILTDPLENVVITLSTTKEDLLHTEAGRNQVAASIKQSLKYDPSLTHEEFDTFTWHNFEVLYSKGTRIISGERYLTREYNILRSNECGMLNISITMKQNYEALYEETVANILNSLEV